jgi:hypothetical protein
VIPGRRDPAGDASPVLRPGQPPGQPGTMGAAEPDARLQPHPVRRRYPVRPGGHRGHLLAGHRRRGLPGCTLLFYTHSGIRGPADRRPAYQRLWGWPTLEALRAGHQTVTAWIAEVAAFLAGATSQIPALPPVHPVMPPSGAGDGR